MKIVSVSKITRGRSRCNIYTLDNGKTIDFPGLVKLTKLSASYISNLIRIHGIGTPLLFKKLPFDRASICINEGVACARYSECQDARLFSKNWEKPEGDCYSPEPQKRQGYHGSLCDAQSKPFRFLAM